MTVRLSPDQATRAIAKGRGKQPESAILRAIRDYLRLRGWTVYRQQAGPLTVKGWPDLIAIRSGEVIGIEVKTPTGRLSEYQAEMQEEWSRQGIRYLVARSVDDVLDL